MFLVLGITITGMTNDVMNRLMKKSEKAYFESYKIILSGYTKAVEAKLKSYREIVDVFNYHPVLASASNSEIKEYLKNCSGKRPSDIISLVYFDTEGNGFTDTGMEIHYENNSLYFNDDFLQRRFYIGNGIKDPTYKYPPVFPVLEPVYDSKGNLKGTLTAVIPISVFNYIFESQNLESAVNITIQDENKNILYSKNKINLMKKPNVNEEDFIDYKQHFFSNEGILNLSGRTLDGKEFDFLVASIPDTNWILALSIPLRFRKDFKHHMLITKIAIILTILLIIILIVIVNIHIQKILSKRQLIETNFDPLTGVATTEYFEKTANRWLRKHQSLNYMVIECDIKNFKFINQKYGKIRGDEVLTFLGELLNSACNEYKGIMGRGYADHFTMMFKISTQECALEKFKNYIPVFNEKLKAFDISFFPTFGIAFHIGKSSGNDTIQSLIGQATFAKNSNKDNLVQNFAVYDSNLLEQVEEELYFEENMKTALDKGEFFVMYQPKIDLTSEKICGAEALVRWNSPKLGLVGPSRFIPVFEKNGFITKLDFFVYEQVFKFQQYCVQNNIPTVRISLNMSRKHADPEKFMHDFMDLFHKYSIPANLIEIEILERSVMGSIDLSTIVDMLHKEGFSVAMDDFGSGESSLNMLTKIPVDVLKFDREFLTSSDGQHLDESAKKFIRTLVNLGKNLNKLTLFEGVETTEQRDFLKSIECDLVQGFLYSRPLFETDFINFVKRYYKN